MVLLRATFNAFAELMAGSFMVEVALTDKANIGTIQAVVTGARTVGSLFVTLLLAPVRMFLSYFECAYCLGKTHASPKVLGYRQISL